MAEEAKTSFGEFFIRIFPKLDDKSWVDVGKKVNKLLDLGETGLIVYGINSFINSVTKLSTSLYNLSQEYGLNQQKMYGWVRMFQYANPELSAKQVESSIVAIQKSLMRIRYLGGAGIRPYQLLGITVAGKNALNILEELHRIAQQQFYRTPQGRSLFTSIAQEMGVAPGMVNLFYLPDEQWKQMKKVLELNKENITQLAKLRYQWTILKLQLADTAMRATTLLVPALRLVIFVLQKVNFLLEGIISWINKHTIIKAFIQSLLASFGTLISYLFLASTALKFLGIAIRLIGIALRFAFALNPIMLAITLLTTAGYLIYKNWEKFKEGALTAWEYLKAAYGFYKAWAMETLSFLNKLGAFGQVLYRVLVFPIETALNAMEKLMKLLNIPYKIISNKIIPMTKRFLKSKNFLSRLMSSVYGTIAPYAYNPFNPAYGTNTVNVTNHNNFNIQGNHNPEEIANRVQEKIQNQYNISHTMLNRGVKL